MHLFYDLPIVRCHIVSGEIFYRLSEAFNRLHGHCVFLHIAGFISSNDYKDFIGIAGKGKGLISLFYSVYRDIIKILVRSCHLLGHIVGSTVFNTAYYRSRQVESDAIRTEKGDIARLIGNSHIIDKFRLILSGDAELSVCLRPIGGGGNFRLGQHLVTSVAFNFGNTAQIVRTVNLHINVLIEEQTESNFIDELFNGISFKFDIAARCRPVNLYRTSCDCISHLSVPVFQVNDNIFRCLGIQQML